MCLTQRQRRRRSGDRQDRLEPRRLFIEAGTTGFRPVLAVHHEVGDGRQSTLSGSSALDTSVGSAPLEGDVVVEIVNRLSLRSREEFGPLSLRKKGH